MVAALSLFSACSTALAPYSQLDDEALPDAGLGLLPDAALDAATSDAATSDAAKSDAASAVRDAGREASLPDAMTLPFPLPDAGLGACAVSNLTTCPPELPAFEASCMQLNQRCAYADPRRPLNIRDAYCKQHNAGRSVWTRAQCQYDCPAELPSLFTELPTSDCARRPAQPCESDLLTPQAAVDRSLQRLAASCNLVSFSVGLVLNQQGCARALFWSPDTGFSRPQLECLTAAAAQIRFGCTPTCALAQGSLL
jgi:hypothetical protein